MKNNRIVVIDDESDVTTFLGAALGDNGFEVHESQDCAQGLALICEVDPALICLDLLMPARSGLSLYRELRLDRRFAKVPILIVSGLGVESDLAQLLGDLPPPDGYLEKPIDVPALLRRVVRLLGRTNN